MKKELFTLLLIILLPSEYESLSSPEPTTDNPHLVSKTRLDEKKTQTWKVSGENHMGIQEIVHSTEVFRKGKGVYGGGDLLRPRSGTRNSSSSHQIKPFCSAPLVAMLLALLFLL